MTSCTIAIQRETLKAFSRRVDQQASEVLRNQASRSTNKAAKRKEWAAKKKEKKREVKAERAEKVADALGLGAPEENPLYSQDEPDFGEVAMAPPQLALKVRRPEAALHRKPLLLSDQLGKAAVQRRTVNPHRASMLDQERTRAIDAYRAFKANNRTNGGDRGGGGSSHATSFDVGDDDDDDDGDEY